MQKLPIKLRSTHDNSYDIIIGNGLLQNAGQKIKKFCAENRAIIISDPAVAKLYLPKLKASLAEAGIDNESIICKGGEIAKSMGEYEKIAEKLLAKRITRKTLLIAFGGGICGDLCGFLAASILRGVPFMQIPTSLLAQVDSAVGGKVGINTGHGKNLIGAFYQPKLVLSDMDLLKSLPVRQLQSGYAEILKYALIDDAKFFTWLEENGAAILDTRHPNHDSAIAYAVEISCRKKANIVAADEKESGRRALLNLGHTFAHALEACRKNDDQLLHGEAVAIGLDCAAYLSKELKLMESEDYKKIHHHLQRLELAKLPKSFAKLSAAKIMDKMQSDKKMAAGKLNFILMRGIGKAFITSNVDGKKVQKTLNYFLRKI